MHKIDTLNTYTFLSTCENMSFIHHDSLMVKTEKF